MRTGEFTSKEGGERGFTLMELLIVVAIIGVLVAIAIPIFTSQLERSREAVDIANSRSAIAVAAAGYMDGTLERSDTTVYYYDLGGSFSTTKPSGYGRGTQADGGTTFPDSGYGMAYDPSLDYTQQVIVAQWGTSSDEPYPTVRWDVVGISVSTAQSVAQAISKLSITDFWSDPSGMPQSNGTYAHQDDLNNSARIEAALAEAGFDTSNFSYQRDSRSAYDVKGKSGYILITLDGKLEASDVNQRVSVARYDPNTDEIITGTAVVKSGSFGRATLSVEDFVAD